MYRPPLLSFASSVVVITWVSTFLPVALAQDDPVESTPQTAVTPIALPKLALNQRRIDSLTEAIDATTSDRVRAELMVERAKEYMRAQQWNKAAGEYQSAAELQPQKSMHWMRSAILLSVAKNRMRYDQLANKMLQHFKNTGSPYHAERTAKMCWLPVPPVDERELAEKLADLAVATRGRPWGEYYPSTRALGHYRYGEYDKALESLAESDRMNDRLPEPRVDLQAINRVLKAMCLLQQGHREDGSETLSAATEFLQKNVKNPELLYTEKWNDWQLATVLHEEARALLAEEDEAVEAPGYDSPQAIYDAVKQAYDNQDWITFAKCHDDDGQTTHAALVFMSALVKLTLISDDDEQKGKLEAVEAICKQHEMKPLLTFIGQLGMFGKIDFNNLKQEQHDRIVNYLSNVKDKPAFIAEMHALLEKESDGNRIITLPLMEAKLVRIDVDGDKAQAVMQGNSDNKLTNVQFRKIDGGWIISAK